MSNRGFTLIELLMVIAIIGMLSTTVLASLKTARLKAADAKVMQQARELRTLMELERNESGTYTGIKAGGAWKAAGASCSGFTSTNYSTKAAEVCNELVAATGSNCGSNCVYFASVNPASTDKFTIQAYLPSKNAYLCLGSSGLSSQTAPYPPSDWSFAGCYSNP